MKNVIVTLILIGIIGLAIGYIVRQKKNGAKCIGCPYDCPSKKTSDTVCSCGCNGKR